MTPTKPPLEVQRAAKLSRKLALQQISLFEVRARHVQGHESPSYAFSMGIDAVSFIETDGGLVALFPLSVDVQHQDGDAIVVLAKLHAVTRIFYRREGAWAGEDSGYIPDYLGIMGWMHAWPYARAEMQSLSAKLGFPPLVLPVLLAGQTANAVVQRMELGSPATTKKKRPRKSSTSQRAVARLKGHKSR